MTKPETLSHLLAALHPWVGAAHQLVLVRAVLQLTSEATVQGKMYKAGAIAALVPLLAEGQPESGQVHAAAAESIHNLCKVRRRVMI